MSYLCFTEIQNVYIDSKCMFKHVYDSDMYIDVFRYVQLNIYYCKYCESYKKDGTESSMTVVLSELSKHSCILENSKQWMMFIY